MALNDITDNNTLPNDVLINGNLPGTDSILPDISDNVEAVRPIEKNYTPRPIDYDYPIVVNDFTRVRDNYIEDTYANIKILKDAGQLIPGCFYCIKDFQHKIKTGLSFSFFDTSDITLPITLANQNKTTKAYVCPIPYTFKILVYAISTAKFSTNAKIVHMQLSTTKVDLKYHLWEIKYCFDNDEAAKFCNWIDTVLSKGAIYYLKDEYGNEANYDFKTIAYSTISGNYATVLTDINTNGYQYHKLFFTFTKYSTSGATELSDKQGISSIHNNSLIVKSSNKYTLYPPVLVKTISNRKNFYNNKFYNCNTTIPIIVESTNFYCNNFQNCVNLYFINSTTYYNEFSDAHNSIFTNNCQCNKVNKFNNNIFHNSVNYNEFCDCLNISCNLYFSHNNLKNIYGISAEIITGYFSYNNLIDVTNILLWNNSTDEDYRPLNVYFQNNVGNDINAIKVSYKYNSTNNTQKITVKIENNQFYNVNNLEIPGLIGTISDSIFRIVENVIVDYVIKSTFIQTTSAFILMAHACEFRFFSGIATNTQNCTIHGNGILSTTFFFHLVVTDIDIPLYSIYKINLYSTQNCTNGLARLFASNIFNNVNDSSLQNIANMMINYVVNNPNEYEENYISRCRYGWIRNSTIKLYWGVTIIFEVLHKDVAFDLGRINAYPLNKYINGKWMYAKSLEWDTSNNDKNLYLYCIKGNLHQNHNIDEMETITSTTNVISGILS